MKTLLLSSLIFLCFFSNVRSQSGQTSVFPPDNHIKKIDPRQYINIIYRKSERQERFDNIWQWEDNSRLPNQKYHFLDKDGEIEIRFDINGLIKNTDFEGKISLEADITGPDGSRKIEVSPYSEVGVERERIGVESDPPLQLSKKILNMILDLREANDNYQLNTLYYNNFTLMDLTKNKNIEEKFNELTLLAEKTIKENTLIQTDIESLDEEQNEFIQKNKSKSTTINQKIKKNQVNTIKILINLSKKLLAYMNYLAHPSITYLILKLIEE
ncbi:hypothetical protein GCM10027275_51780 [Rhabdobacter roseus]|uniref:Uncharacterized protein n=1 Tax=Rhabdobacter roseus TaxID=1655419 RepID=A0A840U0Z7_9BACT|nr:hypothetical protein [Rhabdobacter roseus]MBB5287253.1 hypothetical protein [Rhabdobacter roseus]